MTRDVLRRTEHPGRIDPAHRGDRPGGGDCAHGTGRDEDGRSEGGGIRDGERGAGTLLMAGLALLSLLLIATTALLLQAGSAASRAATAADLAALAAADAVRGLTSGDPCGVAREVADRHAAVVEECLLGVPGTGTALVRVSVPVPGILPDARGTAKAGPPP